MEDPENKIVYPSGSDRAAYSLPMLLPAPALFSMNTVWPHSAESFSASMRATISVGPPAATGTMMRTGLVGYPDFDVCARPSLKKRLDANAWTAESAIKWRRVSMIKTPHATEGRYHTY